MFAQLKKLNIKNRMLLGSLAPATIYLGFPALVYASTNQVFQTFKEVDRVESAIRETNNMSVGAEQMVRGMRGYLVNKNQQFLNDFKTGAALARQSAKAVEPLITNPEQSQRVDRMLLLVNEYYNGSSEIINLFQQNRTAEALGIFNTGKYTKFVNEFVEVNRQFREVELQYIRQTTQKTQQSLNNLILVLALGSVLLLLLGMGIAWLVSSGVARTIERAISSIASSSTQIAATVEEQERMASQQAASVNETTTTMDE
ncbi:MAG: CHASE3 domain-containing protein, partial [Microcoleus sp.]